ncbi:MAG: hypothetical protein J6B06_01645 [Lachnospiraceae bacterium]|nr:hypothetical protein [Lachnospiraceae bacterium]
MDFLKDFSKRMKSVGRYAVLSNNSLQKTTWKQFGIETMDEQMTMLFTVLLYIMEYSLKEENCTLDDIAEFIGTVNDTYFRRGYSYDDCKNLADYIVNVILSNSGNAMYFKAYDYDAKKYIEIHISYIANKIIYLDNGVRRTSYYLTDEGYNLMLSTMELENNLKLTVHEMLFKLHLEKADYTRAVHDIRNVFEQLRIQNQKIQEAMRRIRQNALAYSVEEYRQIIEENIDTIERTREEFKAHREVVETREREFEERDIDVAALTEKDKESLESLRIIEGYLNKALDEHQRILNEHFDLKTLYDMELENYSNMTMVQRFHFRSELYDKVLSDASLLEHAEEFLKPLFWHGTGKIYNPEKAFEYQKRIRREEEKEELLELGLDEEMYREEQEARIRERLKKYSDCLTLILLTMKRQGRTSLSELKQTVFEEQREVLIPTLEIFREIVIELLTAGTIDIGLLRKERSEYLTESMERFQLNEMLLTILDENQLHGIGKIYAMRSEKEEKVCFEHVMDENGQYRTIRCTDVEIWYE